MVHYPEHHRYQVSLGERIADATARGMRFARRVALAFALAVVGGIAIGAAVTDNALAQIFVTILAGTALWVPMLFVLLGVERLFAGRPSRQSNVIEARAVAVPAAAAGHWQRLAAAAPAERERIGALRRSLDNSHRALTTAKLDPDAHDLCVLIDRRLPELIERELDTLPPDDRGRRQAIGDLIALVEQFARHCSRKRDGDGQDSGYQAEILRRRFEERLSPPPFEDQ
jgi:hypothetical protein